MVDIIIPPPEDDERRAARLEREMAACIRNHALLLKGAVQVAVNNNALRRGILDLIEALPDDDDLEPLVEKLDDALLLDMERGRAHPEKAWFDDSPVPEDVAGRIAFFEPRLRDLGRTNYMIQAASSPFVANSEAIRAVLRELIEELDPPYDDERAEPGTMDSALISSIVDDLKATIKMSSD